MPTSMAMAMLDAVARLPKREQRERLFRQPEECPWGDAYHRHSDGCPSCLSHTRLLDDDQDDLITGRA